MLAEEDARMINDRAAKIEHEIEIEAGTFQID